MSDLPTQTCPFCLSAIPAEARKCKHCGEWVTTQGQATASPNSLEVSQIETTSDSQSVMAAANFSTSKSSNRAHGGSAFSWKWLTASLVSAAIALEELIGWEIKRANAFSGISNAELAERFWEGDHPYWRLIQVSTFLVFTAIAYILFRKAKGNKKQANEKDKSGHCSKCLYLGKNHQGAVCGKFNKIIQIPSKETCQEFIN